jgi:hypothetical protein
MGVVTLALARGPEKFAKLVVLKRLHEHLVADPESVQMLLEEARISARLSHPNVVQVYEATLQGGAPTIVMEYLEGQPLPALTEGAVPLPLQLHLAALTQALRGLDAAHELVDYDGKPLNLVHRDVSPHNVFVGYDGVVKVLDFGIAKVVGSDACATKTGVLKGKLRYMSPEQVRGDELDRRSDVFSVGVMLWEAICGRRMWGTAGDGQVLQGLLGGQLPALSGGTIDPRLVRVCERALALDPAHRYPTALAFRRDLQELLASTMPNDDEGLSAFLAQHFSDAREAMRARIAQGIRAASLPPGDTHASATGRALPLRRAARWWAHLGPAAGIGAALSVLAGPPLLFWLSSRSSHAERAGVTGSSECEPGQKSCDGQCVSIERPEHGCGASTCAACAPANATARCGRDNACGVAMCYRGYDDCDGIADNGCEVFLRTDPQHCGSCSKACPELPHAQVGCGDTCRIWRCAPGYEDCNAVTGDGCEVALRGDSRNCGACGNRCAAKQRCREGQCVQ